MNTRRSAQCDQCIFAGFFVVFRVKANEQKNGIMWVVWVIFLLPDQIGKPGKGTFEMDCFVFVFDHIPQNTTSKIPPQYHLQSVLIRYIFSSFNSFFDIEVVFLCECRENVL